MYLWTWWKIYLVRFEAKDQVFCSIPGDGSKYLTHLESGGRLMIRVVMAMKLGWQVIVLTGRPVNIDPSTIQHDFYFHRDQIFVVLNSLLIPFPLPGACVICIFIIYPCETSTEGFTKPLLTTRHHEVFMPFPKVNGSDSFKAPTRTIFRIFLPFDTSHTCQNLILQIDFKNKDFEEI